ARDFLFRVRNAMHFLTNSHQDQLTFDLQEEVAGNLGYAVAGNGNLKPVERFLKDYYLQASTVTRFAQAIIDRSVNPPRPYRLIEAFLSVLRSPYRVYETLHEMHKLGVLSRMIPEWEHLLCLVLHDLYHIYTVDEHSLMGVRELERLRNGEFAEGAPLLTQVM